MASAPPLPSPIRRWLIIGTVMMATLVQVLDTTIANVALPHMQAALGANTESINWVLTSYIIMAAILTPATGWLEARIGRRNLLMTAIIGFTVSSALCGAANSLPMMVTARILQGSFGALISPLAQAIMLDSSSRVQRAQTVTIFSMGVTLGPIMGPVIGGVLTASFNWRWIFFINIPMGVLAAIGAFLLIPKVDLPQRKFDLFGFSLLATGLACFQLLLDRGSQQGWFESTEIIIETGLMIAAIWMFTIHAVVSKSTLLPTELLKNRNFVISMIYILLLTGSAVAGPALMAPMLQVLMGYDTITAGLTMAPRGLGGFVAMPIATVMVRYFDPRLVVGIGLGITFLSFWTFTGYDLEVGREQWMVYAFMQGMGPGMAFMPASIFAFATIPTYLNTEAAAFSNLLRSLGGSVTVAVMGAMLAHNVQVNHAELAANITSAKVPLIQPGVINSIGAYGPAVFRMLDREINRQALMIAYLDDFWVMMWATALVFPLLFFLRKPAAERTRPTIAVE
jgi:DHA2 family multidrug resistance protein